MVAGQASTVYQTIKRGYTLCIFDDLFHVLLDLFIRVDFSEGGALAPSIDPPYSLLSIKPSAEYEKVYSLCCAKHVSEIST